MVLQLPCVSSYRKRDTFNHCHIYCTCSRELLTTATKLPPSASLRAQPTCSSVRARHCLRIQRACLPTVPACHCLACTRRSACLASCLPRVCMSFASEASCHPRVECSLRMGHLALLRIYATCVCGAPPCCTPGAACACDTPSRPMPTTLRTKPTQHARRACPYTLNHAPHLNDTTAHRHPDQQTSCIKLAHQLAKLECCTMPVPLCALARKPACQHLTTF